MKFQLNSIILKEEKQWIRDACWIWLKMQKFPAKSLACNEHSLGVLFRTCAKSDWKRITQAAWNWQEAKQEPNDSDSRMTDDTIRNCRWMKHTVLITLSDVLDLLAFTSRAVGQKMMIDLTTRAYYIGGLSWSFRSRFWNEIKSFVGWL